MCRVNFIWTALLLLGRARAWITHEHHASRIRSWRMAAGETAAAPATSSDLRSLYSNTNGGTSNGTLRVGDLHNLYYEVHHCQDKTIKPLMALFLHGGPGAGCTSNHARFFDPERYTVVLLDQRGSGRSTPRGETRENTLLHLVDDCEALRTTVMDEPDRPWDVVLGGSWGSTLAIAYGQTHPRSVAAIILRGVCLLRPCEVDWLFASTGGAAKMLPQVWKQWEKAVGIEVEPTFRANPRLALQAYYQKLLGSDLDKRKQAARSWMSWEMIMSVSHRISASSAASDAQSIMNEMRSTRSSRSERPSTVAVKKMGYDWYMADSSGNELGQYRKVTESVYGLRQNIKTSANGDFEPQTSPSQIENWKPVGDEADPRSIPAQNMLTCFYSTNDRYATNNLNLLDPARISNGRTVPTIAIQGGDDRICPPDTAIELSEIWPELEVRMPIDSGHSMYDPAIQHEILQATDRVADWTQRESKQ